MKLEKRVRGWAMQGHRLDQFKIVLTTYAIGSPLTRQGRVRINRYREGVGTRRGNLEEIYYRIRISPVHL